MSPRCSAADDCAAILSDTVTLLPSGGLSGKPRRQRRLAFGNRLRLGRRSSDFAFQALCVGQPGELVGEHQRVLRRDFELLAAGLAGDLVVESEEIVAELGE